MRDIALAPARARARARERERERERKRSRLKARTKRSGIRKTRCIRIPDAQVRHARGEFSGTQRDVPVRGQDQGLKTVSVREHVRDTRMFNQRRDCRRDSVARPPPPPPRVRPRVQRARLSLASRRTLRGCCAPATMYVRTQVRTYVSRRESRERERERERERREAGGKRRERR